MKGSRVQSVDSYGRGRSCNRGLQKKTALLRRQKAKGSQGQSRGPNDLRGKIEGKESKGGEILESWGEKDFVRTEAKSKTQRTATLEMEDVSFRHRGETPLTKSDPFTNSEWVAEPIRPGLVQEVLR